MVCVCVLQNLVDFATSTPLQDECVTHVPIEIVSELLVEESLWSSRASSEELISIIAPLLDNCPPTPEMCRFFSTHCVSHPRSPIVVDKLTPIAHRILKHNVDFSKSQHMRHFVQDYIRALYSQNAGESVIQKFVASVHGPGSGCPHPRVLPNLVAVCLAAIFANFEERRTLASINETTDCEKDLGEGNENTIHERELQCYITVFLYADALAHEPFIRYVIKYYKKPVRTAVIPYIPGVSEKLKKIGNKFGIRTSFKSHTTLCSILTKTKSPNEQQESKNCIYNVPCECGKQYIGGSTGRPLQTMIERIGSDSRCSSHQMVQAVRKGKEGWFHIYCPSSPVCTDEGQTWGHMLTKKQLGACLLLALRGHLAAQEALCLMLEWELIEQEDQKMQLVSTLQSTSSGREHYAALCQKQMHLRELQQKGGPRKLTLPSRSTDADIARLLSCGSFGNLEVLSLAFTHVTSACAEQLIKLPSLKYLNLWATQFGDTGLLMISEHLHKLQVLNLCETPVSDKGIAALAEDVRAIRTAQEVFKDDEMEGKLAYIKTNFRSLPSAIDRLQERGIALGNSIALVKDVQEKLDSVVGDIGEKVSMKIRSVMDKNPAMTSLRKLNLNSTKLSAQTFEILKQKLPALQEFDVRYTEAW
ncbi:hypothetical protein C0J52_15799 [Blattella germanica]|nr:hypothetical protein C0J52_15799 [Blattella germanica]